MESDRRVIHRLGSIIASEKKKRRKRLFKNSISSILFWKTRIFAALSPLLFS